MIKKLTCIECPKGCVLSVSVEGARVIEVSGAECPKGDKYAASEIENPMRILTSTVISKGLALKMLPVRTDRPIPKAAILKAMEEIKRIRIDKPVNAGDILMENFLNSGVNLIATRDLSI